jgi:hypothetical protein
VPGSVIDCTSDGRAIRVCVRAAWNEGSLVWFLDQEDIGSGGFKKGCQGDQTAVHID